MDRIKLTLPENFSFTTAIKIRITDLNYGGHVGNDVFLSLIQEGRQQFLNHHGYGELQFEGVGLIMSDAVIEFKKELNYGDEVTISVAASGFDRLGFDLYYKLEVNNVLAGKAKTGMLCYDYDAKKVVALPEAGKHRLTIKTS